jgi:hypothetical protein
MQAITLSKDNDFRIQEDVLDAALSSGKAKVRESGYSEFRPSNILRLVQFSVPYFARLRQRSIPSVHHILTLTLMSALVTTSVFERMDCLWDTNMD